MTSDPIENLRARVCRFFNEAAQYHLALSCTDEDEPWHTVLASEFQAGLALVPSLITQKGTFANLRALRAVRDTLIRFRHGIEGELLMTAMQLQQLLDEIRAVEQAMAKLEAGGR